MALAKEKTYAISVYIPLEIKFRNQILTAGGYGFNN